MSKKDQLLYEEWIGAKFNSKLVVSASKNGEYINFRLSAINGKEYNTKLGRAMAITLGTNDVEKLISALTLAKNTSE